MVEMPVIHHTDHFLFQNVLQQLQIDYHARNRVGVAFHRYFHDVVMTVPQSSGVFAV